MRQAFLVLLAARPAHGYELKTALERGLAGLLPPLNDGQVYTTLARLERDGLVEADDAGADGRRRRVYSLTPAGRAEALGWLAAPAPEARLRDEFVLKLALAATTGLGDVAELLEQQRLATLGSLRELDAVPPDPADPLPGLLREGVALHLQARLRWLDACEEQLIDTRKESDGARG